MKKLFAAAAIYVLAGAAVASAQTSGPVEPTLITSDGPLEMDNNKKVAIFDENVVVIDAQGKVNADHMEVFFDKDNEIDHIYCKGNVKIDQKERRSESDEAVYEAKNQKLILTGNPVIKQGLDEYKAEKITIFTAENRVIFEPSAQLVIYPDKNKDNSDLLVGDDEE